MKNNNITLLFFIFTLFISSIYAYKVVGNKIYDPTGKEILIRGIDRPSMEWDPNGERLSLADYTLMRGWGANVVRVSLSQDHWFADASGYKARVKQQVDWIRSLGMGVIFDLHWNNGGQQNMADRKSITFWSEFATVYKSNPWVIFELYNEPHDVSWQTWRNGDSTYGGMQEMYNAIRATGSNNVVIVCGLNWAFDLSGVSNGYALTGSNITYGTHPYDFPGKQANDWDYAFGNLAATYPIVMTEFGQYCAQNTYVQQLLAYTERKGIHWTAWAWYAQGCGFPSIISDWNGTPFGVVGNLIRQYLGGGDIPPTPTNPPAIPATTPKTIYSDSLGNGFEDWSWSTSYSLSDSSRVRSGSYSVRFAVQKFEAIYFQNPSSSFSLGSYSSLTFYVYSLSSIFSTNLAIILYDDGETEAANILFPVSTVANAWTTVSIPVNSFGISTNTLISGIAIQSKVDSSLGNLWIDDIAFVPSGATVAPTVKPTTPATVQPTTPATVQPTNPATVQPTNPATVRPTTPATVQPTNPATVRPTNPATVQPTNPATVRPTNPATVQPTNPATVRPTNPATVQPTNPATVRPTNPPSSSGCDASNIVVSQTVSNSWSDATGPISQYGVTVSSTCVGKTLTNVVFTLGNWNPVGQWGGTYVGNTLTLPGYVSITTSSPFTGIGFQNRGPVTFTVTSFSFQ